MRQAYNHDRERLGANAWNAGNFRGVAEPRLLFGRMYEDYEVEIAAFRAKARVFCIASAGCTSLELARRGFQVTAVDINPVQVRYLQSRMHGAAPRMGDAEHMLERLRRCGALLGFTHTRLERFLILDDTLEQATTWRKWFQGRGVRLALHSAVFPLVLKRMYSPALINAVPVRFATVLIARLARGFSRFPNRTNCFAWRLLIGNEAPGEQSKTRSPSHVTVTCADACEHLERAARGAFDAFSLSNILDGISGSYANRLATAVKHSAAPGATVVLRSFAEPTCHEEADWAARDRSMLWGRIIVCPASEFGEVLACRRHRNVSTRPEQLAIDRI